ncbi:MAG: uncharacterized protein JWN88_192 [Frankiales bacterium]|jgi:hypothetical protein|nr:uncharacterized protein [Frankiales bacterium]
MKLSGERLAWTALAPASVPLLPRRPVTPLARARRHRAVTALSGVLAAGLLLTGCSAGTDGVAGPQASSPSTTAAQQSGSPPASPPTVPSLAPTPPPPPAPPARRVIALTVAGGEVTGVESRVPAQLGEALTIRVTSDVSEQVHVHGYDLQADVAAGGTVQVDLEATIPGSFEVELHRSHKTLFQLRVS